MSALSEHFSVEIFALGNLKKKKHGTVSCIFIAYSDAVIKIYGAQIIHKQSKCH